MSPTSPVMDTRSAARARWVACAEIGYVGLPFCVFKVLTGWIAVPAPGLAAVGWALIALGIVDLALNGLNLVTVLVLGRRVGGVCLADLLCRRWSEASGRHDLGLAIDVLLSFTLVAIVIGSGLIARLSGSALVVWNVAVVLNVLGAGIGRLLSALGRGGNVA